MRGRTVAVAVASMAGVLVGVDRPVHATETVVVSGVAVFSSGLHPTVSVLTPWQSQQVTMTETQQGVFVAGDRADAATITCTYTGSAQESYLWGDAVFRGSCAGRGVTGYQVAKTCIRHYSRLAQYLVATEDCTLHVGPASETSTIVTDVVAHLPPPPTDRYYYTGTATSFP